MTRNLHLEGISRKFSPLFAGPFRCLRVKGTSAELALPPEMAIHPWFHSSLLKPHKGDLPAPQHLEVEGEADSGEFEVEKIVDKQISRNRVEYLVKWRHYGAESYTWEPLKNLSNAKEAVAQFEQQKSAPR